MLQERTMLQDWCLLSDEQQIALSRQALGQAMRSVVVQAECLAYAIETGDLDDRGGPEALRLFAQLVRQAGRAEEAGGHA